MKRPILLAGTIIALVITSILSLSSTITFFSALEYAEYLGAAYMLGFILAAIICILATIFNADSISAWKKSKKLFKNQKGYIITAIVFNFILAGIYLISFLIGMASALTVLVFLTILAGNILMLVDFCRENNKVEKVANVESALKVETNDNCNLVEEPKKQEDIFAGETIQEIKQRKVKEEKNNSLLTLESKLIKLNEMKEQGLIDQDEYNEIKKSYIKDEIKR